MIKKSRRDDIIIERINEQNKKTRRGDIIIDQENNKSRRDDIVIERINEQNQKPRRGDIIKSYMPGTFSTASARLYRVGIQRRKFLEVSC